MLIFVFRFRMEFGKRITSCFLFLVYGMETNNLYFCGNIKETKMAALEDVLDRDFVRRFLVEQKTKFHTKTKNKKRKRKLKYVF